MTLMVKTESHGEVESGFCGVCTQFARLGEYTFATRHLCELARYFANNPEIKQSQILGYDLDKFWEKQNSYTNTLLQAIIETEESGQKSDLEKKLEGEQGRVSVEDDVDLHDEGRMVDIRVTDDEKSITIGEYRISAIHFGIMTFYLANGGFMGWLNEKNPEFAQLTMGALKNSKREFYREIGEEIRE